jgi:hypothetical protein
MSKSGLPAQPAGKPNSQIIIYQTESGQTKIEVRLQDETVWLTQKLMAELFQTMKQNISLHLSNIFAESELDENSVVKDFLTTAADGKNYSTKFYNLEAAKPARRQAGKKLPRKKPGKGKDSDNKK